MKAPWELSTPAAPGEGRENLPDAAGIELGAQLARLCDVEEVRQRETFPNQLPRCNECAFRLGTRPNGCSETLMDAVKCVMECLPFYCHKGIEEGDAPKRLCSGWALLAMSGEYKQEASAEK